MGLLFVIAFSTVAKFVNFIFLFFLDFMQASTSMLEAKGEEILSWCEDDNFILEDDLAPDFEVKFGAVILRLLLVLCCHIK